MGFKYIIIEVESEVAGVRHLPIIFPDELVHVGVAAAITSLLLKSQRLAITSAGEINLTAYSCSGGSETLFLESDPGDAELINLFPWCHGVDMPEDFKQTILNCLADAPVPARQRALEDAAQLCALDDHKHSSGYRCDSGLRLAKRIRALPGARTTAQEQS